jgi:hypothetical protein
MTEKTTKTWHKVKVFNTYEEAEELRSKLKTELGNEDLEIKIRRCGPGQTQFKVKTYRPPTKTKK